MERSDCLLFCCGWLLFSWLFVCLVLVVLIEVVSLGAVIGIDCGALVFKPGLRVVGSCYIL